WRRSRRAPPCCPATSSPPGRPRASAWASTRRATSPRATWSRCRSPASASCATGWAGRDDHRAGVHGGRAPGRGGGVLHRRPAGRGVRARAGGRRGDRAEPVLGAARRADGPDPGVLRRDAAPRPERGARAARRGGRGARPGHRQRRDGAVHRRPHRGRAVEHAGPRDRRRRAARPHGPVRHRRGARRGRRAGARVRRLRQRHPRRRGRPLRPGLPRAGGGRRSSPCGGHRRTTARPARAARAGAAAGRPRPPHPAEGRRAMTAPVVREPGSTREACALLAADPWGTKVVSGGTALVLMMRQGLVTPQSLVALWRIPGLAGITRAGDVLRIGATTTLAEVAASPLVRSVAPSLAHACSVVGNPRIRNVATLGGNLAEADYASDPPAALASLGARCHATGPDGTREIPVRDLVTGFYETVLDHAELITHVDVPIAGPGRRATYLKFRTR